MKLQIKTATGIAYQTIEDAASTRAQEDGMSCGQLEGMAENISTVAAMVGRLTQWLHDSGQMSIEDAAKIIGGGYVASTQEQ